MISLIDAIGYMGTFLIVAAYWITCHNKNVSSKVLNIMNLAGAICVGSNAYYHDALPGLAINTIWSIIAVHALFTKKDIDNKQTTVTKTL